MSITEVNIYNLALQKLGAGRVTTTDEDSRNARSCRSCYEFLRDLELSDRAWVFSIKRASLAASATAPEFGDLTAYPLPSDCIRLLFNDNTYLDWQVENIDGSKAILTSDGAPLNVRYISRVTDTSKFDPNFIEMLACRMAWQMCDEITQSSSKIANINAAYIQAKQSARQTNAFQTLPQDGPEDTWLAARRNGSSAAPWLRFQDT